MYVMIDLETTGWNPDQHAILSIGAVALNFGLEIVGEFSVNMQVPQSRGWDSDTVVWWTTQPEAMAVATVGAIEPEFAVRRFLLWVREQQAKDKMVEWTTDGEVLDPIWVANPIAFDLPFLNTYGRDYCPELWKDMTGNTHGINGIDMPTLASQVLGLRFDQARRRNWPESWKPEKALDHTALGDAKQQAHAFQQMMRR